MAYDFQTTYNLSASADDERAQFFRRVFMHLAGAVALFAGIEYCLVTSEIGLQLTKAIFSGGEFVWLGILGGFALVSWLCRGMAQSASRPAQYFALGLYTLAEALIFLPLIVVALAVTKSGGAENLLMNAAIMTGILFLSLVLVVLVTRRDFSFLRTFLLVGGLVALGLIVCGAIFGFDLGLAFSGGMIVLAGASILYDTSRIMHNYDSEMYVSAALELFASLMLLFWYVLRLLISLASRD